MILGIDTSNYTTSIALVDADGTIQMDKRIALTVKQGERGLRQSHALFQHMENLPILLKEALKEPFRSRIQAVSVSSRPRPVEGSYMPVFRAGMQFGEVLSNALSVPYYTFSHQEGHLSAAAYGTPLEKQSAYFAYHLSGGTCELLEVNAPNISVIGGTKDISFGQLLDRFGVSMGLAFPAGKAMDEIALSKWDKESRFNGKKRLKPIPVNDCFLNLSGIETQAMRALKGLLEAEENEDAKTLLFELFLQIGDALVRLTNAALKNKETKQLLFTGGVSSSAFLRSYLLKAFSQTEINLFFGRPELSSDNAVGTSLLGGKALWH